MAWSVQYSTRKVEKNVEKLPEEIRVTLKLLIADLEEEGPMQTKWKNFGKLRRQKGQPAQETRYHCHIKKGRPTYVAVWRHTGKTVVLEVSYVGTHENAPY